MECAVGRPVNSGVATTAIGVVGGVTWTSTAPISQVPLGGLGRARPRWSVVIPFQRGGLTRGVGDRVDQQAARLGEPRLGRAAVGGERSAVLVERGSALTCVFIVGLPGTRTRNLRSPRPSTPLSPQLADQHRDRQPLSRNASPVRLVRARSVESVQSGTVRYSRVTHGVRGLDADDKR